MVKVWRGSPPCTGDKTLKKTMGSNSTNRIRALLERINEPALRSELQSEIDRLLETKQFGLVFEEHTPEVLPLPRVAPRIGARVAIKGHNYGRTWLIEQIVEGQAYLTRGHEAEREEQWRSVEDLIVVRRFGEAIYPKLEPIMEPLERAPGQPFHTIIQSDNYHALQLLSWGYERSFDVIYIDPPYNTGNRDWKYNNDYVDKNDRFRHSKWLSMMKKRLKLAKELLKNDGVLVCAIDEWEIYHLGMLIEELFPTHDRVNVTVVHNERGTKSDNFAYCHETLIFIIPAGQSIIQKRTIEQEDQREWKLRMWGANSLRSDRRGMFHPIYVENDQVVGIGEVPEDDFHPSHSVVEEDTRTVFWPIDIQGVERRWRWSKSTIADESHRLSVRVVSGRKELFIRGEEEYLKTVWRGSQYDSSTHGSRLVKNILGREFPFPKSLYAVKDALNTVVKNRPNALILDFFAGSGTTLHATALLNAEDGGKRRCILVTNNEVSENEEASLTRRGFKPGDEEWETEGICRAITIPRCKYVIQGGRDDGTELSGTYLNGRALSEGFEANLRAFRLDFLDPSRVERGCHFEDIAPILWLMAGAQGDCDPHQDSNYGTLAGERVWWLPTGAPLAVLLDEHSLPEFLVALHTRSSQEPGVRLVCLITDSHDAFNEMSDQVRELLPNVQTRMLYRNYLDNFRLQDNTLLEESPYLANNSENAVAIPANAPSQGSTA
jgi:adenine-specific DNA-methyltransferase